VRRSVQWLVIAVALSAAVSAHDIITTKLTYTRDISRIMNRRCLACHAQGSSIPLTNYAEVRPWAVDIKEQVLSRAMPPWGAVKGFGNLEPDHALTQEEILIIAAWVIGGAPEGNPALLPKSVPPTQPPAPRTQDAVTVLTRKVLEKPLEAVGVRPSPERPISSARIIAQLPDGKIEPLVWLYQYDPKWNRTFLFRKPLDLPQGTVIESSAPLRFAIEQSRERQGAE
jgi:hypothetical protein